MPVPPVAPLIGTSLQLALEVFRIARKVGELKKKQWYEFKAIMDKEFSEDGFDTSDELRKRIQNEKRA